MDPHLRVVAVTASVCLFLLVLELVRQRRLLERYALLWLASAFALVALSAWDQLLQILADMLGASYPPSALFAAAFFFIIMLLLHFSVAVSRLADQSKMLAQRLALSEERLAGLEARERRADPLQPDDHPTPPIPQEVPVTRTLTIDGVEISDETPTYVIAEIGHNHGGDLDTAMALFDEARRAGAHAVKLQKRDNRSLYTRAAFDKPYENENSYGATYGEHREALEFGREEYQALIEYSQRIGVTFFSTAFDMPSAAFLADLDMPAYKIASADLRNIPLLRHVASFGKPMVLSTGASSMEDVERAHAAVAEINPQIALLQCTAGYPAKWDELDLGVIQTFREMFPETVIGLSSHDNGIAMAVAAHALGARVIEKHFTLDRVLKGTDHRFSLEPQGLRKMCRDLSRLHVAIGDGRKKMYESEAVPAIKMAKKLVAARDLPAGHVLEADDIAMKSPGDGLAPFELDNVLGRRLTRPVLEDEGLRFEILEELSEEALAAASATDAG